MEGVNTTNVKDKYCDTIQGLSQLVELRQNKLKGDNKIW